MEKNHIVVTDYYSNYPEAATLQSTTSRAVIAFLKTVFARHGVPNELFSDNGPQFSSCEFEAFAKEWGFNHHTSSPNYPRSNGLAESSVKIKGIMKKADDGNEDFHKSLLIYRSAPLQNGRSPAQMLMGRRIRTNLPMHEIDAASGHGCGPQTRLRHASIPGGNAAHCDRCIRLAEDLQKSLHGNAAPLSADSKEKRGWVSDCEAKGNGFDPQCLQSYL
ncbi:hypothetical protein N1851_016584 [Merluccius polli]|uniref:Integrase catalytic domain-containing protein n=1 Tax=Merluccius polli TaxID=89951 RepID=A0AA47P1W8_MERPO|nr:hypothetical protein N1851_016584 [Merluccius polli]